MGLEDFFEAAPLNKWYYWNHLDHAHSFNQNLASIISSTVVPFVLYPHKIVTKQYSAIKPSTYRYGYMKYKISIQLRAEIETRTNGRLRSMDLFMIISNTTLSIRYMMIQKLVTTMVIVQNAGDWKEYTVYSWLHFTSRRFGERGGHYRPVPP